MNQRRVRELREILAEALSGVVAQEAEEEPEKRSGSAGHSINVNIKIDGSGGRLFAAPLGRRQLRRRRSLRY